MVKIAISDNLNFEYSDVDIVRKGISYTIDSIVDIKRNYKLNNDEIYYLIGSDSLIDFKNWKDSKEILDECNVIVAIRPGFRPSDILTGFCKRFILLTYQGLSFLHLK